MGLFAFSGAGFNTSDVEQDYSSFRIMAWALMAQRLCMFVQYGAVLWSARKYRAAMLPIACTTALMFSTAMIFIGLIFAFPKGINTHADIALYVKVPCCESQAKCFRYIVSFGEAVLVVVLSCTFRTVGYRHTNLVERVGLLTLIILGEGAIGVIRSIATALITTTILTRTMILLSFSGLLVLVRTSSAYHEHVLSCL